jgi:glutathione S-transferase
VNRHLIPAFYRYLQAQEEQKQVEGAKDFLQAIEQLVEMFEKAEKDTPDAVGLWKENGSLGWSDTMAAPWLFRMTNVLTHYRGFTVPSGEKISAYLNRLFEHPSVKATTSDEQLYLDSYTRYAENRPNTSQVANATNSGRGLP